MLDHLLDLMAHVPPITITAGLFPQSNAFTRAAFHPTRTALLHLCHGGIARGFTRTIHLDTLPRAGECCRRTS